MKLTNHYRSIAAETIRADQTPTTTGDFDEDDSERQRWEEVRRRQQEYRNLNRGPVTLESIADAIHNFSSRMDQGFLNLDRRVGGVERFFAQRLDYPGPGFDNDPDASIFDA